jgi:hypothetical protein
MESNVQTIVEMQTMAVTVLGVLFLTGLFLTIYFIYRARAKERLLLIEKGVDISNLPSFGNFKIKIPWLKIGIVVVSFPLGFLLGGFLELYKHWSVDLPGVLAFLFTGIGMIVAHYADRPKAEE